MMVMARSAGRDDGERASALASHTREEEMSRPGLVDTARSGRDGTESKNMGRRGCIGRFWEERGVWKSGIYECTDVDGE